MSAPAEVDGTTEEPGYGDGTAVIHRHVEGIIDVSVSKSLAPQVIAVGIELGQKRVLHSRAD